MELSSVIIINNSLVSSFCRFVNTLLLNNYSFNTLAIKPFIHFTGEESAPYIVMLPDQDMKQMFITVNERYITEKDMFGKRCEMLDLKCLQSLKKSEEVLTGRDIIGRVLLPVVTLEFDYVKKDMRQRKYAMEDDNMAQVG